jgi:putative ABC transport system permease protein
MPPRALVYGTDLWLTMGVSPSVFPRERRQFQILARVRPEANLEQVSSELAAIAAGVQRAHGAELEEYEGWRLEALTWTDVNVRLVKPAALMLMGAVGFVLLLVCANVASLLLARATTRRTEIAVRTALGANRSRIVHQLLTESTVLAAVGGAAGVALAWVGARALMAALDALTVPVPGDVGVNGRVLAFTAAVALACGVGFGAFPAMGALRGNVRVVGAFNGGQGRLRLQRALVTAEVGAALVLLVGGGLLVHSFARLSAVDPGVSRDVLTFRLTLPWERYDIPRIRQFFQELEERASTLPGVERAAVATQFPPGLFTQRQFWVEGTEEGREGTLPVAFATIASPSYFETLGIPVLLGRALEPSDLPESPPVVVVNETAARRYFPEGRALGRRIKPGGPESPSPWLEVVGVVADTRNAGADQAPRPELFVSARQQGDSNQLFVLLRTSGDPYSVLPAVREIVRAMDPQQPIYALRSVGEAFAEASLPQRVSAVTMSVFAGFALLLAVVGIYGVVSYAAAQRTREIGIRLALGARKATVRRMVVRQALIPVAVGGTLGLAAALVLGRLMRGMLFELSPADPPTVAAVTLLFLAVSFVASWIPARRASALEPASALREEGAR